MGNHWEASMLSSCKKTLAGIILGTFLVGAGCGEPDQTQFVGVVHETDYWQITVPDDWEKWESGGWTTFDAPTGGSLGISRMRKEGDTASSDSDLFLGHSGVRQKTYPRLLAAGSGQNQAAPQRSVSRRVVFSDIREDDWVNRISSEKRRPIIDRRKPHATTSATPGCHAPRATAPHRSGPGRVLGKGE